MLNLKGNYYLKTNQENSNHNRSENLKIFFKVLINLLWQKNKTKQNKTKQHNTTKQNKTKQIIINK